MAFRGIFGIFLILTIQAAAQSEVSFSVCDGATDHLHVSKVSLLFCSSRCCSCGGSSCCCSSCPCQSIITLFIYLLSIYYSDFMQLMIELILCDQVVADPFPAKAGREVNLRVTATTDVDISCAKVHVEAKVCFLCIPSSIFIIWPSCGFIISCSLSQSLTISSSNYFSQEFGIPFKQEFDLCKCFSSTCAIL